MDIDGNLKHSEAYQAWSLLLDIIYDGLDQKIEESAGGCNAYFDVQSGMYKDEPFTVYWEDVCTCSPRGGCWPGYREACRYWAAIDTVGQVVIAKAVTDTTQMLSEVNS